MNPLDSATVGFIENANYSESSVTYNSTKPDGVTIRMQEQGTYCRTNFSHSRTEFSPQHRDIEEGNDNNGSRANGCWPAFRSQAAAATRGLWDAAQSSLKSVKGRIQGWPGGEEDAGGPRWIVRITSQYDNQRGESVDDITEWEFRSAQNAELFVMQWNKEFQKNSRKCFPYDITIFMKQEGDNTSLEEEIKKSMAQATPRI